MMSIVLDLLYATGLVLASPVWLYRMIAHGRYRTGAAQRFGAVPRRYGLQPTIWIHAVSLGEVNAARSIVAEIHRQLPDFRVVVSSTTDTGMTQAKKLFAPDHMVFQWPLDFSLAVRASLKRIRPSLVILMEGEAWPNFLRACNRRGIPVTIVNGRLSADKGYPRYKKLGPLAARLFNRLSTIGVQDESYAERFRSLGVAAEKLHVTGMIKYDTAEVADSLPGQEALAAAVGLSAGEQLLVAGGTGPGEEQILLEMFRRLKSRHAKTRLAIVPRKPERFEEVARLISDAGLELVRRSKLPDGSARGASPGAIILGDTMGELRKFYALAACVFVGRTLVPMGGSDMIEAAALGKPTAYGPHTFNFPQAKDLAAHGCVQVSDPAGLESQLDAWLSDPDAARKAGHEAQDFIRSSQGATKRNIEMICGLLGRAPSPADGGIATDKFGADRAIAEIQQRSKK